jgi:hypothetical protein
VEDQFDWRRLAPRIGSAYEATLEHTARRAAATRPAAGARAL